MKFMEFRKYNSIENHYQKKQIKIWTELYPEFLDDNFVWSIQEKIDRANIQIFITKDEFVVSSRKRVLDRNVDFYGIWDILSRDRYKKLIKELKKFCKETGKSVRLYGEIYGKGIQKRINYGDDIYLTFFDMEIGEERLSPKHFEDFFKNGILYNMGEINSDLIVPSQEFQGSLLTIIDKLDVENLRSIVAEKHGIENSFVEGVVIKPYNAVYTSKLGQIIYIKKKAEKFKEISKEKHKIKKEGNPIVEKYNNKFREYINENRIKSVFSKEGEIKSHKEIGKYIKLVLEDAKKDFLKDLSKDEKFEFDNFDKKDVKTIFNVGSKIVNLLQKYL